MARVVRIICDRCGKEISEADSVTLQGQLSRFNHYELTAGKPQNGIGARCDLLFGRNSTEGTANQTSDFCPKCWSHIEPKLDFIFKKEKQ